MKQMKKNIGIILLFMCVQSVVFAQNPAIFKGGTADGWMSQNYIQSTSNIFKGGNGDGWDSKNYQQTSVSIFKGGIGDGWDSKNYQQTSVSIFKGGISDGWDSKNYTQTNLTIFKGGNGDGWVSKNFTQSNLIIFKGGIGDGWASTYRPVSPLPVTLLNFTAQKQGSNATLVQWKTSTEINTNYFDVERSSEAINFQFIGKVNAAGNSSGEISYSFTDNQPLKGVNYYRLKQVDRDGRAIYSPARLVRFDDTNAGPIKYYPNPTNGILNIEITKEMQQEAMVINISNAAGVMIEQIKRQSNSSTILMLDMKRFARGTYFIQVKTNTTNSTQRIVLQ